MNEGKDMADARTILADYRASRLHTTSKPARGGWLRQGEAQEVAVASSLNFYSTRLI